jgi:hypothetical protein
MWRLKHNFVFERGREGVRQEVETLNMREGGRE